MARYLDRFTEEEVLKVVKAYLVDGLSHRKIQFEILGLPSPARGGGFVTMDILHHFNINGDKKGILAKEDINDLIKNSTGNYLEILKKIKDYFKEENEAEKVIRGLNTYGTVDTEITVETKQRVGQDKLRNYILDIYEHKCALCDIDKDDLLICSHIIPWRVDEQNRLNPKNAICLCAQHDKLFDKGYFSLDENYKIIFGMKADDIIINLLKDANFREPLQDSPDKELLKIHFRLYCK
ncbi:HNH endonuclease [Clostridium cylindrosporum]|uniref:HNH endonuclease n=1 Tax=Clostridium cylindrosporum DSM 605 TaxID=1121307 RepID=A0A0J8G3L9_CLOCY|nr:HNH endonuclease signature motif containing protein [Clostridium cylindrosporum]KMT22311.1 HNH endonuclease [Clostridium cylindrosporum DSM 605]